MDSLPHFRYKVLKDASRQFRLLRCLGVDDEKDLLSYELDVYTIDTDIPEFAAISYTWGVSQQTGFIIVNSSPFEIRKTAFELLVAVQRLQSDTESPPAYLWIDSICINQGNLRERSMQVRLMRNIYSSAKVVLVWLGAPTPGSDIAMQRLSELRHQDLEHRKPARADRETGTTRASRLLARTLYGRSSTGISYAYHGDPDVLRTVLNAKVGDALLYLFKRRYWHRMWVIQEVLMAKDVRLLCGSKTVEWNKLNSFFGGLEYQRLATGTQFHGSTRVSQIMNTWAYRFVRERCFFEANPHLKARGAPVSDLLQAFGSFECADKHDKIYGILGLSRDRFDVNYSKSLFQLHNDVLHCVVSTAQMETISKAETFSRVLADTLGISAASHQLTRASDLFHCPPKALRWTDPRPFWEADFAQALPQSYMHHFTSIISLSMTPAQISRQTLLARSLAMNRHVLEDVGGRAIGSAPTMMVTQAEEREGSTISDWGSITFKLDEDDEDVAPDHVPLHTIDQSVFDYTVPPASADDSDIHPESTRHVDYLDHEWEIEDLLATRKHVRSQKDLRRGRLDNALWRSWNKQLFSLPTTSPETINWLKEVDVTWLYGPFVSDRITTTSEAWVSNQIWPRKKLPRKIGGIQDENSSEGIIRFDNAVEVIEPDGSSSIETLELHNHDALSGTSRLSPPLSPDQMNLRQTWPQDEQTDHTDSGAS